MIRVYVEYTNDTSIIVKALPTLVEEHQFFMNNRTVDVEADGETYTLNHYQVSNTQPRPESYYEDYTTANNNSYYAEGGIIYPGIPLGKISNHDLQTKCINYLFIVRSLDKNPRSDFDVETIASVPKLIRESKIDSERTHTFFLLTFTIAERNPACRTLFRPRLRRRKRLGLFIPLAQDSRRRSRRRLLPAPLN
jgi:hypothetical protein